MRVGFNPHKDKVHVISDYFHQVVIPVYIPNQEDYFKDSFEILKLCLNSLFKTIHNKTYITIVNNGSCDLIVNYLNELYKGNKIQEIIHVTNIGYINAMLKGITGQNFELITTSDADVLFLEGWQRASYNVFQNFSKCGVVCPTPSSRSLRTYTANLYWDFLFSNKMKFKTVTNLDAFRKFGVSVGNPEFYNEIQLKKYLTISNNEQAAVIGAGHYVVTYRASIFNNLESRYTDYILGGNSDDLFDLPVVKKGFWRLSTADNYAYHMGNIIEDWMYEEVSKLEQNDRGSDFELKKIPVGSKWSYFIKSKLFGKFILNKKVMRYFLIWKGLDKEDAKNYLT
ncbi:glycosyltransferase family A protein [Flavobacterium aestivum]|uniref:glycosyltransferase family A protein n=1 Tax=Flavobacterium aestivum TaxID=3003257 RepID=UPI002285D9D2|nr:glycosyltransferase family A protein [Flavobacterium aestivum]